MSLASGVATAADDLRKTQTVFYNETAKNQVPSWGIFQGAQVPKDILKAVKTFDPYNNSMDINHPNMRGYFRSPIDNEGIKMMNERCKKREASGWQSLIDGNIANSVAMFIKGLRQSSLHLPNTKVLSQIYLVEHHLTLTCRLAQNTIQICLKQGNK